MNFAILFFITLFTGILSNHSSQPTRTEIKNRFNNAGDCNPNGTMTLCGRGIKWDASLSDGDGSVGQCVHNKKMTPYLLLTDGVPPKMESLTEFQGELYFTATDRVHGKELWKYDGTSASMVANINNVPFNQDKTKGSYPQYLTVFKDALYFSADDGTNGIQLWKYDGTNAPTMVANSNGMSSPESLTVVQGSLYFTADDGTNGRQLWKYDGTNDPSMISDGSEYFNPRFLTEFQGDLFFAANSLVFTNALVWKYDGSSSPYILEEQWDSGLWYMHTFGVSLWDPQFLTVLNNILYFTADDGSIQLWKYDGTNEPTMVANSNGMSDPQYLTVYNNALYFKATDGPNGYELWKYDAINDPTMVADINPGIAGSDSGIAGSASSDPHQLVVANNALYFTADDGVHGQELWKYEIVEEDIFSATDPFELWKKTFSVNDNSVWGMVADISPGTSGSQPSAVTEVNNELYFTAEDPNGPELWKYMPLWQ